MKFKVGDIIKGKENLYVFTDKKMKKARVKKVFGNYMRIEVIEPIFSPINGFEFNVKNSAEYFELIETAKEKFTKSDLIDGDIVTYRDGRKRRKNGDELVDLKDINRYMPLSIYTNDLKDSWGDPQYDIIKVERPVKCETVYERTEEEKKEILNEVEKEYLKAVIKPFKNKIKYINKIKKCASNKEYIEIVIKDNDIANLPDFDENTMYKEMELDKHYTLAELKLQ